MDTNKKVKILGIFGIIFFILTFLIPITLTMYTNVTDMDSDTEIMFSNLEALFSSIFLILAVVFIIIAVAMVFIDRKNKMKEGEITEKQFDEMKKNLEK